jgi:hypothetical protein
MVIRAAAFNNSFVEISEVAIGLGWEVFRG